MKVYNNDKYVPPREITVACMRAMYCNDLLADMVQVRPSDTGSRPRADEIDVAKSGGRTVDGGGSADVHMYRLHGLRDWVQWMKIEEINLNCIFLLPTALHDPKKGLLRLRSMVGNAMLIHLTGYSTDSGRPALSSTSPRALSPISHQSTSHLLSLPDQPVHTTRLPRPVPIVSSRPAMSRPTADCKLHLLVG